MSKMAIKLNKSNLDMWLERHQELKKFILTTSYIALCGMGLLYVGLCIISKMMEFN